MTEPAVGVSGPAFEKEERLKAILSGYGRLAVAYSGGVDSTYLAAVAHEVLGKDAELIIADSPSIPRSELAAAKAMARERGWNLTLIKTNEFDSEEYLQNGPLRCYHCKTELFQQMEKYARDKGVTVTTYGAIAEDALDLTRVGHRARQRTCRGSAPPGSRTDQGRNPGIEAAAVACPPPTRPRLPAWRRAFPTGIRVSREAMSAVERAEETLKSLGFHQYRVRPSWRFVPNRGRPPLILPGSLSPGSATPS
ncbi:MAG: TIGR00268 family protein [Candidatus Hydrogenedentales bacterium]